MENIRNQWKNFYFSLFKVAQYLMSDLSNYEFFIGS